jgi:hypothetical protein
MAGKLKYLLYMLLFMNMLSCGIYGRYSESRIQTVSVDEIKNNVNSIPSDLCLMLTEKLRTKLDRQPDLQLTDKDAEIQISGKLTAFTIQPLAYRSNQIPITNRVTISVYILRNNKIDKEMNLRKECKIFVDYKANQNFGTIKDSLYNILSDKMTEEIYYHFFMQW